jgi:hypothetical protein
MAPGTSTHPAPSPPSHGNSARGRFVRASVVVTVLIFVFTITMIGWRWLTVDEPTAILEVTAAEALDGAQVSVEGLAMRDPLATTLSDENRYRARFFLHPGTYTLHVELDSQTIAREHFDIPRGAASLWRYDLTQRQPEQHP